MAGIEARRQRRLAAACAGVVVVGIIPIGVGGLRPLVAHASGSVYAATILADSPAAYWRLGEASGTTAADASGNGNAAQYVGGVTLGAAGALAGDPDTAATLDGTTGYVTAATLGAVQGDHARSVELWFTTTTTISQQLYDSGTINATAQSFQIGINANGGVFGNPPEATAGVYIAFWGDDYYIPDTFLADGAWHHLVVTLQGATLQVFVDSRQPGGYIWNGTVWTQSLVPQPATLPVTPNTAANPILVGNSRKPIHGAGSSMFAGTVDEVAIYPTALTAAQVAAHYQASGRQAAPLGGAVSASEDAGGSNPAEPRVGGTHGCSCQPVDTANGNFWHTFTDLSISGRGLPLQFTRTYNAINAASNGPFGYGWSFPYGVALSVSGSTAVITEENGSQVTFTLAGGAWTAPPRVVATLVENGDGTSTFTRQARERLTFSASGQLLSERDLNGYTTTLAYNGSGQLTSVTDPAGRAVTVGWTGSHITSLTDANVSPSRTVQFQYNDGAGNLTDVTDVASGNEHFVYDANHLLLSMRDPRGNTVTNHYDASSRVDWQTDGLSRKTSFAYAPGSTTITDPQSNVVVEQYTSGLRTAITRGSGTLSAATWTVRYDPSTLGLSSVTDPNGHTRSATYDASANLLTATDALGRQTVNTYDGLNDLLTTTDPLGVTTTLTWDAAGNLQRQSRPLVGSSPAVSQVTSYTDGDSAHPGDVTAITDPNSKIWSFTYDSAGDLASQTDPLGDRTTSAYNGDGWLTSTVSPLGNVAGCSCAATYTTTIGHNAFGQVTTATDPLGHTSTRHYDPAQDLDQFTDADGNHTTYVHDAANQQTQVQRADTTTLVTDYNADGTVLDQKDGKGNATTYSYDPLARVVSVSDPLHRTTAYSYDGAGNLHTLVDPQSQTTTFAYDAADELTGITYSDGHTPNVSGITYDADGQRTAMTDGTGTWSWTWDSLHRLTSSKDGSGATVGYGYDLRSQLTALTYPGQSTPVQRTYDDAGRLTAVRDWLGNSTAIAYDADGNLLTETFPTTAQDVDTFTFDAADHLTQVRDTKAHVPFAIINYNRDANAQLTSAIPNGLPGAPETYGYTALNQLKTVNAGTYTYDAADNVTGLANGSTLAYDAANEVTSLTPAVGGATTYGYDARGNRTSITPSGGATTTLSYDQANRLTAYGTGATYVYSGDGLRMSKTVSNATTAFVWDLAEGLSLLLQERTASGTTSYVTGPGGLPLEQISATGGVLYYHHDQLGSTRALTDGTGVVQATYTYDAYGNTVASTGSASNPLQFAGQYRDAEDGFYYLRARYYDPATVQFISRDPMMRLTGSAYNYVRDNPLNRGDPSGELDLPLGLCLRKFWGEDTSCRTALSTSQGVAYIGIALGVAATLTGFGALADAEIFGISGNALGAAGFSAGLAAGGTDGPACFQGDDLACFGLAMAVVGSFAATPVLLGALVTEGSYGAAAIQGLSAFGVNVGAAGTAVDLMRTIWDLALARQAEVQGTGGGGTRIFNPCTRQ